MRNFLPPLLWALVILVLSLAACGGAGPSHTGSEETPPLAGATPSTPVMGDLATSTTAGLLGEVTPQPTGQAQANATPDLYAVLAQVSQDLPEGRMVFNPPAEMRQGVEERIELRVQRLSPGVSEQAAQATLEAGLQGSGAPQTESLKVATVMKARLTGEGFNISPLSEEAQFVSNDTFTQWAWDVTAVKAGRRKLNLQITIQVNVDTLGKVAREWPVKTKTVVVRVNPLYSIGNFVGAYWQWLATTLLIPISAWLYRLYSSRKAGGEAATEEKKGPPKKKGTG